MITEKLIRQTIPSLVTLAALFFGFAGIFSTLEAMRLGMPFLLARSAKYIMLALVLDGLDGNLARWINGSTEFGAELDTFVDFTAFSLAPAALLFAILLYGPNPLWRWILPTAIVFSGAVRMSRFRAKDPFRGQGGFIGLPITVNSSWIALVVFAALILKPQGNILVRGPFSLLFQLPILVMILFQLSTFRYPKPSNQVRYFAPATLAVIFLFVLSDKYAAWIATILAGLCLVYVFIGPAVHKKSSNAEKPSH
ncbi:MAG: CDP-alcohol phosphatidyltransferase family protein [Thermovirgaceae bacterium]|nr:CDP-alcohol phosphatidyltransferase family protein [Thermovirgaceae bacterium]